MLAASRLSPFLHAARARIAAACLPALLLAACGGGGGSGGVPGPGPGPGPLPGLSPLAVTALNQKAVAADALDTGTDMNLAIMGANFALAAADAGLDSGSTSDACTNGGSVSTSAQLASAGQLVPGDTITISMNACRELVNGVEGTTNGMLSLTVVDGMYGGAGATSPSRIVLSVGTGGLTVITATQTFSTQGQQTVDYTETGWGSGSLVVTGDSLGVTLTTAGVTHSSTLKNYRQAMTITPSLATLAVNGRVETNNPRLGNVYYDISTPSPLAMDNNTGAFTGGTMKMSSTGSALQLAVTGYNAFSLQLDANGDGTYELTTPVTIEDLRSQL